MDVFECRNERTIRLVNENISLYFIVTKGSKWLRDRWIEIERGLL